MESPDDGGKLRTAIILAGGEGTRLRDLTHKIAGHDVPKQFCRIVGETTLLEQTLQRAALVVPPGRTLTVVTRAHERFYRPLLRGVPEQNLVVQPENRGTSAAIIYSLLRLATISPAASVAFFPSDHHVDDDTEFMCHVNLAFEAVKERPELTVLLGIAPNEAEVAYGWIEPARPVSPKYAPIARVLRFWEKPSREVAKDLLARGCLWNSFVMVARISTLLGLFMMAMPELYAAFTAIRASLGTVFEEMIVKALYGDLHPADFSERVLMRFPANLAVLPVCGVMWSDLGEPRRVMDTLSRLGLHPAWAAA